uniref:Adherens junctions associated protein 1 n=1 Tax=Lepisosteus oculatus TaxID=7918 RepID=W5MFX7_LEPOC
AIFLVSVFFSSMSPIRPGGSTGRHAWILLAMIHLTMDFSSCSPVTQGAGFKLISKPLPRHRLGHSPLWDAQNRLHWKIPSLWWQRASRPGMHLGKVGKGLLLRSHKHRGPMHKGMLCKECQSTYSSTELLDSVGSPVERTSDKVTFLKRPRRQVKWGDYEHYPEGRTTTVPGFIDWGPTGGDDTSTGENGDKPVPNSTVARKPPTATAATIITTTVTTKSPRNTPKSPPVVTTTRKLTTTQSSVSFGETIKPPKPFGDTAVINPKLTALFSGLAVHQIITITVSLIMVIAALITTLVLKNCCAQSGNGRHNSHQRKINQQEESCQNLTDFTHARIPSSVDIFTAYNDSLQCSHECVRTAVPVYTDEMIQQTPVYKTAYNGNRPSPTERQLIPVAFVSEKWFEISC